MRVDIKAVKTVKHALFTPTYALTHHIYLHRDSVMYTTQQGKAKVGSIKQQLSEMLWKIASWLLQKTRGLLAAVNENLIWKLCRSYHGNQNCRMNAQTVHHTMNTWARDQCLDLTCKSATLLNLAQTAVMNTSEAIKKILMLEWFVLSMQEKNYWKLPYTELPMSLIHETKWTEDWTFHNYSKLKEKKYKLGISLCL